MSWNQHHPDDDLHPPAKIQSSFQRKFRSFWGIGSKKSSTSSHPSSSSAGDSQLTPDSRQKSLSTPALNNLLLITADQNTTSPHEHPNNIPVHESQNTNIFYDLRVDLARNSLYRTLPSNMRSHHHHPPQQPLYHQHEQQQLQRDSYSSRYRSSFSDLSTSLHQFQNLPNGHPNHELSNSSLSAAPPPPLESSREPSSTSEDLLSKMHRNLNQTSSFPDKISTKEQIIHQTLPKDFRLPQNPHSHAHHQQQHQNQQHIPVTALSAAPSSPSSPHMTRSRVNDAASSHDQTFAPQENNVNDQSSLLQTTHSSSSPPDEQFVVEISDLNQAIKVSPHHLTVRTDHHHDSLDSSHDGMRDRNKRNMDHHLHLTSSTGNMKNGLFCDHSSPSSTSSLSSSTNAVREVPNGISPNSDPDLRVESSQDSSASGSKQVSSASESGRGTLISENGVIEDCKSGGKKMMSDVTQMISSSSSTSASGVKSKSGRSKVEPEYLMNKYPQLSHPANRAPMPLVAESESWVSDDQSAASGGGIRRSSQKSRGIVAVVGDVISNNRPSGRPPVVCSSSSRPAKNAQILMTPQENNSKNFKKKLSTSHKVSGSSGDHYSSTKNIHHHPERNFNSTQLKKGGPQGGKWPSVPDDISLSTFDPRDEEEEDDVSSDCSTHRNHDNNKQENLKNQIKGLQDLYGEVSKVNVLFSSSLKLSFFFVEVDYVILMIPDNHN